MKDLIIKGSVLKKELYIFLGCFVFAVVLNIYSIAKYKTAWSELIGQLHIVILVSIFVYILVFLILRAVRGIRGLVKK